MRSGFIMSVVEARFRDLELLGPSKVVKLKINESLCVLQTANSTIKNKFLMIFFV